MSVCSSQGGTEQSREEFFVKTCPVIGVRAQEQASNKSITITIYQKTGGTTRSHRLQIAVRAF